MAILVLWIKMDGEYREFLRDRELLLLLRLLVDELLRPEKLGLMFRSGENPPLEVLEKVGALSDEEMYGR